MSTPTIDALARRGNDARLLEPDVAERHDCRRNTLRDVPGEITGLNREPVRARRQLPATGSSADPLEHATWPLRPADDAQPPVDEEQPVRPLVRAITHTDDVPVAVAVGRYGARPDRNHPHRGRGHVDVDGVRQDDRPVGATELDLRSVAAFGHEPAVVVTTVPEELLRAACSAFAVDEGSYLATLVVEQRELEPVGPPQPERDRRPPLRAVADRREHLVHRRPGDRGPFSPSAARRLRTQPPSRRAAPGRRRAGRSAALLSEPYRAQILEGRLWWPGDAVLLPP